MLYGSLTLTANVSDVPMGYVHLVLSGIGRAFGPGMKTGAVPAKEDASSKWPSAKMELAYLIAKHGVRIAWFTGVAGYIWILLFPLVTITTGEMDPLSWSICGL